jgi:succinate dehydrogenase/fumarate reductase-like Fe-S protein
MTLHLNIAMLTVLTLGIGWLMVVAGVQKSALEWRRRRRICPSCGRQINARVCTTCSS